MPPLFLPPALLASALPSVKWAHGSLPFPSPSHAAWVTGENRQRAGLWGERLVCTLPTWGLGGSQEMPPLLTTVADGTPARPSAAPQLWRPVGSDGSCWHRIPGFTEPSACGCCVSVPLTWGASATRLLCIYSLLYLSPSKCLSNADALEGDSRNQATPPAPPCTPN